MAKSLKPIEERDPKKRHAGRLGGYKGGRKGGLARAKLPKHLLSGYGRKGGIIKGINAAKRKAEEKAARAPALAALNAEIARNAKSLTAEAAVALDPLSPLQIEAIYRRAYGYRDHDSKSTGEAEVAQLVARMNRDGRNGPKPKPEKRKRGRPRKGE